MSEREYKVRYLALADFVIALSLALGCFAGSTPATAAGETDASSLELYRTLLQERTQATNDVVQTRVDYRALKRDPSWKQLVNGLAKADPKQLTTREERLAFWINAYNIFAIDLVLGAYPVESIKDIGSFFYPVWKMPAGKLGGREYTLEEIEHKILRRMGDPRIHSAIVCASISCPPLAREPFEAARVDEQLDSVVRAWLANPKKGQRLDRSKKTLHLSKIFNWFESDFEARGGVVEFVATHIDADDARWLRGHSSEVAIEYFDYDWSLNE